MDIETLATCIYASIHGNRWSMKKVYDNDRLCLEITTSRNIIMLLKHIVDGAESDITMTTTCDKEFEYSLYGNTDIDDLYRYIVDLDRKIRDNGDTYYGH